MDNISLNDQIMALGNVLKSQLDIINIEGLSSSLYMERWKEGWTEYKKCPDCHGYGYCSCYCGNEHDCHVCGGSGEIEIDKMEIKEESTFITNIVL